MSNGPVPSPPPTSYPPQPFLAWNALSQDTFIHFGSQSEQTPLTEHEKRILEAAFQRPKVPLELETLAPILKKGIDLDKPVCAEYTPAMVAAQKNAPEILTLLAEQGATLNLQSKDTKTTALHEALWNQSIHAATHLLDQDGINVNLQNRGGMTPLMVLLENPKIRDKDSTKLLKAMLLRDVDPNLNDLDGRTALARAAESGNRKAVARLLQHIPADQLDINEADNQGKTPLILAVEKGHPFIAQLLLERGADPNLACNEGNTAYDYAQKRPFYCLTKALLGETPPPAPGL
jgi:ankyrin repeat protein